MKINAHNVIGLSLMSRQVIFCLAGIFCLMRFMSPPLSLALGLLLAQTMKHPFFHYNNQATNLLLKVSVIGLGFGMNIFSAIHTGSQGVLLTVGSVIGVLTLGALVRRLMKVEKKTSFLISAGTAICGGSAIATLSPLMKASGKQVSVAFGTVFILNSVALIAFPPIGHALNLSQTQFGLWCAIAIHDTSSVIGATAKYGPTALQVATTVKLARALWIIPVAFGTAFIFKNRGKVKIPYFIGLFILAMIISTYLPVVKSIVPYIVSVAERCLTLTLFLIGTSLSFQTIRTVGIRPMVEGVLLWIVISTGTLYAIITLV